MRLVVIVSQRSIARSMSSREPSSRLTSIPFQMRIVRRSNGCLFTDKTRPQGSWSKKCIRTRHERAAGGLLTSEFAQTSLLPLRPW